MIKLFTFLILFLTQAVSARVNCNENYSDCFNNIPSKIIESYSDKDYQGKKIVFLTGVDEAKFKKPIIPGNSVYLEVSFLNSRKNFFKFSGKAIVKNQVMAIANFSAMLTV